MRVTQWLGGPIGQRPSHPRLGIPRQVLLYHICMPLVNPQIAYLKHYQHHHIVIEWDSNRHIDISLPVGYTYSDVITQDPHAWAERVRADTDSEPMVLKPGESYGL